MKKCSICGLEKELNEYYSQNKIKADGTNYIYYQPYCKTCTINKSKKYQKENKEYISEYNKKDYQRKEQYFKDKAKRYDKQNKIKRKKQQKEWRQTYPDKVKEYNTYKIMNKTHNISKQEWEACKQYFNNKCAYCGLSIEEHFVTYNEKVILGDFHKEHVDHSGANDLSNCVPACKSCNTSKRTSTLEEWYNDKKDFYSKEREDKIHKWLNCDYKLVFHLKGGEIN